MDKEPVTEPGLHGTIFKILQASIEPKPIKELANEVKISYADVMEHLAAIGKNVQIQYVNLPDGVPAVEIFRVPSARYAFEFRIASKSSGGWEDKAHSAHFST